MSKKVEMSVRLRKLRQGEKGQDGVGSYTIDLDNDNIAIGLVSSEGSDSLYPAEGYNYGESGIYTKGGVGDNVALTRVDLVNSSDNILATATASSDGSYNDAGIGLALTLTRNKITVTFDTAVAHSSGEKREFRLKGTMTVTDGGGTRTETAYKVLSVIFQPPGSDGKSPVVYELLTSVDSVVIRESGARYPTNVTARVVKRVGSETSILSTTQSIQDEGLAVYYKKNGGSLTSGLSVSTLGATSLVWYLKKGTVEYDCEELAFVRDGSSAVIYSIEPSVSVVHKKNDGTLSTKTITCKVWKQTGSTKVETSEKWLAYEIASGTGGAAPSEYPSSGVSLAADTNWVKFTLYDSSAMSTVLDSETVFVISDGSNGESPITIDLSNENIQIPCEYDGTPIGTVEAQTTATLYCGATPITEGVTWGYVWSNCSGQSNGGTVTVVSIDADKAHVLITATYNGVPYSAKFSLVKVRAGKEGEVPTVYDLRPAHDAIQIDASGNRTPSSTSCKVLKRSKDGCTLLSGANITGEGLSIGYELNGGSFTAGNSVSDLSAATSLKWLLKQNYVEIDSETIPFVSDGQPGDAGDNGENSVIATASPSAVTYVSGEGKTVNISIAIADGNTTTKPDTIGSASFNPDNNAINGVTFNDGTLSIESTAKWQGIVTVSCTYKGKSYSAPVTVSRVTNGSAGPKGLITRTTEWMLNTEYHNDSALVNTQDVCFLDIVYKTENGKLKSPYMWQCMATHTSSADTDPEADTEHYNIYNESEHWRRVGITGPIYTSLLLAENGSINFLQSNQLRVFDAEGNLKAGMAGASGGYPVIYANPRKYPIYASLSLYTSATSTDNQIASDDSRWKSSGTVTVANNAYLHFRFTVRMSDGNEFYSTRFGKWQNTTGASMHLDPSSLTMRYRMSSTTNNDGGGTFYDAPCTTVACPHLWVRVYVTSDKPTGSFRIANQSNGYQSDGAMYQQYENGNAQFGMPDGARLLLNAAPGSGLPRMEIFKEDGSPAATYDGSVVSNSTELFGNSSSSVQINCDTRSAYGTALGTTPSVTSSSISSSFVCDNDSMITIPAGVMYIQGVPGTVPSSMTTLPQQQAECWIEIDGNAVCRVGLQLLSSGDSYTYNFKQVQRNVSKGSHTIRFVVQFTGWNGGSAAANVKVNNNATVTCLISAEMEKSRYFANGFAIGSRTDNYIMAWNDNSGGMRFCVRNGAYGFKVDNSGVYILRPGTADSWYNLKNLIDHV